MNRWSQSWIGQASVWLVAAGILFGASGWAGERIVFGNEKSRLSPEGSDDKMQKKSDKGWLKKMDNDPISSELRMPYMPNQAPLDPKKEKLQRKKQLEEKNWMFVNRGELQEEEEDKNFLGVRDDDPDSLLKEDRSDDLMLRGILKKDSGQRYSSAQKRNTGPGQKNNTPPPVREEEEDTGRSLRSSSSIFGKNDSRVGAHTSSELDLGKLFELGSSSKQGTDRSEGAMGNLFQADGGGVSREQQSRRDDFRNFLNGPKAGPAPNMAAEAWKASMAPAPLNGMMSKPSQLPSRIGGVNAYGALPGYAQPSPSTERAAKTEWNQGRVSGFNSLPPPDSTRARGMNTLGGHHF